MYTLTAKTAKWISAAYKQTSAFRFEKQEGIQVSDDRVKPEHHLFLPDFFYLGRPFYFDENPIRPLDTIEGQSAAHPIIFSEMYRASFQDVVFGRFITYSEAGKKNRSTICVEVNGDLATVIIFPHKSLRDEVFSELKHQPNNPLQLRPVDRRHFLR